jgi:hypothetical protein
MIDEEIRKRFGQRSRDDSFVVSSGIGLEMYRHNEVLSTPRLGSKIDVSFAGCTISAGAFTEEFRICKVADGKLGMSNASIFSYSFSSVCLGKYFAAFEPEAILVANGFSR